MRVLCAKGVLAGALGSEKSIPLSVEGAGLVIPEMGTFVPIY